MQKDKEEGNELKVITLNTLPYSIAPKECDRRSESVIADEDMHIVALEHFIGVGKGSWSDNGHILSKSPENPWVKWGETAVGMEPTGTKGYFGYCGRDYYSEVSGSGDVTMYESFPPGCYFLVKKGEKLYMHCYSSNFMDKESAFHHAVRLIYW
ncbi:MAG: hypothetical protein ACUVXI_03255 [bacterium]